MTDRINALTVVLSHNIRDDDIQPLIDAIRQFNWVLCVKPEVADTADFIAYSRARSELSQRLWDALNEDKR